MCQTMLSHAVPQDNVRRKESCCSDELGQLSIGTDKLDSKQCFNASVPKCVLGYVVVRKEAFIMHLVVSDKA